MRLESHRSRRIAVLAIMAAGAVAAAGCGTRQATSDIIKYEGADGTVLTTQAAGPTIDGSVTAPAQSTVASTAPQGAAPATTAAASGGGAVTVPNTPVTGPATSGSGGGPTPVTGTASAAPNAHGGGTTTKPAAAASTAAASNGSLEFPTCTTQGPPVVIGQVGSLSGLVGANLQGAIKAPYVWVNYANAHGGLGCHPIKFVQIDDQSDPASSQAAVETEVEKDHAIALFGAVVPLDISGFIAGLTKEGVANIGGDQAATEWLTSKYLYPVGGTSRAVIAGSVKAASAIGRKKIAVLYCVEASPCGSNFYDTIVKDGFAQKYGMSVVYSGSISITQPDFTAQCQNAKNAGADTIAWGLDKAGLQRAAKSCANIGYFPTLTLISLQSTFDTTDPNIRKSGAFLSSPVWPYLTNNNAAENEFFTAMKQYAPGAVVDSSATEVWADGMMLEKIVDALGPSAQTRALTKDDIFAGAAKIQNETLHGLIPPTSYQAQGPQSENGCYYPLQFSADGTFSAPSGDKYSCIS